MQFRLTMDFKVYRMVKLNAYVYLLFHTWPGIGAVFISANAQTAYFPAAICRSSADYAEMCVLFMHTDISDCNYPRLIPPFQVCNCNCKWRKPRLIITYSLASPVILFCWQKNIISIKYHSEQQIYRATLSFLRWQRENDLLCCFSRSLKTHRCVN